MIIHISVFTFTNEFEAQAAQTDVFNRFTTFANIWRFSLSVPCLDEQT